MRDRPVNVPAPTPAAFINAQSAITGLRGRDLLSTLRSVAAHGLRNPLHSAQHALALGGQLGRVLLGETVHEPNPHDSRFADPTWTLNPLYRRSPSPPASLFELAETDPALDRRQQP
jgi:polyhydroxyalkanoate synthase